ncbi:MAG: bifunctional tetrahydrofolate synthase/dihydrofolate synthase [Gammaproteobacteria bacterium]|nr:bifunctional tetrahydrofolate synthase/dihydrofolate synthase [Gammaproteobacteria bacterium]
MRFSSLDEWLTWQESLHPKNIDLGLERLQVVAQKLFTREDFKTIITVAGTNGKGSVCAMLSAIYHSAGFRAGWYSSPHLLRYNERIRIGDVEISDQRLCEAFEKVDQARGDITLTYFEFGTLAALEIFRDANLDVVVLEVGLGGRLDAVNILDADVAVLTTVDLDHQDWLGPDRESIAREKLGIGRENHPLVCGDLDPPCAVSEYCLAHHIPLYRIRHEFAFFLHEEHWHWQSADERISALPKPVLNGVHQYTNAAVVLMVTRLLKQQLPLSNAEIRNGLLSAVLPGRLQMVKFQNRMFMLDVAHNPQAARALASAIENEGLGTPMQAVVGMLRDKDALETLKPMLPRIELWHVAGIAVARGGSGEHLKETLMSLGVKQDNIHVYSNVRDAIHGSMLNNIAEQLTVVFGSFYTVSDALQYLSD